MSRVIKDDFYSWELVESTGEGKDLEWCINEAILMAGVTGSVGATASLENFDGEKTTLTASAKVKRLERLSA